MIHKIKGDIETRTVWVDGEKLTPTESLKLRNHSPDGFMWGYGGSGPSQLALAILLRLTDKESACYAYQDFKWEFVSKWQDDFEIEIDIEAWVSEHYINNEMTKEANEGRMLKNG